MTSTRTPIAEQVVGINAGAAQQLPPAVLAAFGAEQDELDAAGVPDGVLEPGAPMPDGSPLDATGAATTLTATRAGRPAVVVFYRGAWCPYCNLTLRTYQQELVPALAERSVSLVAISPQKADGSLTMQETNELTYSVLSDPGNQLAGALDVLMAPGSDSLEAQQLLGIDPTEVNADGTATIPMPTVAIVDAGGTLRWIDVHPNYTTRTEPAEIIVALDSVLG